MIVTVIVAGKPFTIPFLLDIGGLYTESLTLDMFFFGGGGVSSLAGTRNSGPGI